MATGYDRRQPTRDTFAFQPAAPVQAQSRRSGQSRGAQIVGGQSVGGVVAAGPQTDAGPVAAGLGALVEDLMRPHLQRRQTEEFFNGFTKAQSGVALEEITKSNKGLSKIFGPTAYEEGAQFYTARTKLNEWSTARMSEMDQLKRLPPEEFSKLMAKTSQDLMTGDPFADQLMQSQLIEMSGPLMNTYRKERYAFQQQEAVAAHTQAMKTGATAFQTTVLQQARLGDTSDPDGAAITAARNAFLSSMAQPVGMDDEAYRKGLYDFMRGAMQDGNFYAVQAMRAAGVDRVFTEEEQVRLQDAEHRYGQRVLETFMSSDPGVADMIAEYETRRMGRELNGMQPYAASEAAAALAKMNAYVRVHTGVDEDVFDWKDSRGEIRSVVELTVRNWDRAQERKWQLEDREYARETKRLEREAEIEETATAVGAAWASGDVNAAIAMGLPEKHFNRRALAEFRHGNLVGLTRAFVTGGYVSDAVQDDVQARVASSIDQQYGERMERAYSEWRAMVKANPGMAARYYGEWHVKMRTFDTLSRQVGPTQAFVRAFGDSAIYSSKGVEPRHRKAAEDAVDAFLSSREPAWYNPLSWGRHSYSESAKAVMRGAVSQRLAEVVKNSDESPDVLASEVIGAMFSEGALQTAAGQVWRAASGSRPFNARLGLQQDEADKVFSHVVDRELKAVGFKPGINGHLSIGYVENPGKGEALLVVAHDPIDRWERPGRVILPLERFRASFKNSLGREYQERRRAARARADAAPYIVSPN